MENSLPPFKKMRFRAFRTIRRGIKIVDNGINLNHTFEDVLIDQKQLQNYREMFGFQKEFPFTYLYIFAQRAQMAMMLEPEYTIALPGMIHLQNDLKLYSAPEIDIPFSIETQIQVDYKESGSLNPKADAVFFQNDEKIAISKSGYLAKRKRKKKKSIDSSTLGQKNSKKYGDKFIPQIPEFNNQSNDNSITWDFSKSLGKEYAKVSGDANPIHTSWLFAKLFGFKRPIIHGWYSASRVVSEAEKIVAQSGDQSNEVNHIKVNFVKPIYLPSRAELYFANRSTNSKFEETDQLTNTKMEFMVKNPKQDSNLDIGRSIIHLYGKLK